MAVRKKLNHDDKTREKIQTTQLIKRLTNHALGELELNQSQVRAIEILLKKTLPDLQSIEQTTKGEQSIYMVSDKPLTAEEWADKYASDSLGTPGGAASSTH